jgi:hypothetical protein
MIIIIIEQVDQQDRSTQSTDKARDKKNTQKREKTRTFATRTEQLIFYCRSLMTGLTLPNSIDATTIIIILN